MTDFHPTIPDRSVPASPEIVLTLDQDWAPDHVTTRVADLFLKRGVRSTWFITHESPLLNLLRSRPDLFELGIHPNFLPGSDHGSLPADVLRHCLQIVPEAACLRAHAVVQSGPLTEAILTQTSIRVDVTHFLPGHPALQPFLYQWKDHRMWRLPYYWEDSYELHRSQPCWDTPHILGSGPGLRIMNFHPISIFLNLNDPRPYETLKRSVPRLQQAREEDTAPHLCSGSGPATALDGLLTLLSESGRSRRIGDIVRELNR
jgi:hypothetical protein